MCFDVFSRYLTLCSWLVGSFVLVDSGEESLFVSLIYLEWMELRKYGWSEPCVHEGHPNSLNLIPRFVQLLFLGKICKDSLLWIELHYTTWNSCEPYWLNKQCFCMEQKVWNRYMIENQELSGWFGIFLNVEFNCSAQIMNVP